MLGGVCWVLMRIYVEDCLQCLSYFLVTDVHHLPIRDADEMVSTDPS